MELTNTSYLLLGMLAKGPKSGYDVKRFADNSTRFFWAISYGQIYPELKRLADAGFVQPQAAARGERERTVYQLTRLGEEALRDWVVEPVVAPLEIRDEMLLKLFFSDVVNDRDRAELLERMQRREQDMVARLKAIEPIAKSEGGAPCRYTVLRGGLGLHSWLADFFAREASELVGARVASSSKEAGK
jgi:PadR family transcriptional regulator AphA